MGVPEHIQAKRKAIIKEACDKYAEKMVAALLVGTHSKLKGFITHDETLDLSTLKASAAVRG